MLRVRIQTSFPKQVKRKAPTSFGYWNKWTTALQALTSPERFRSALSRRTTCIMAPMLCRTVLIALIACRFQAGWAAEPPQWTADIVPLLKRHCVKCHGPAKQEGKLNLSTAAGTLRGGKDGPALMPHDLEASLLWKKVSKEEMPPEAPLPKQDQ